MDNNKFDPKAWESITDDKSFIRKSGYEDYDDATVYSNIAGKADNMTCIEEQKQEHQAAVHNNAQPTGSKTDKLSSQSQNDSLPSQNNMPNTGTIEQPKRRKLKAWKKVLISVFSGVLVLMIGVSAYFLTCFFAHKPYKLETEGGVKTEYYFGDKLIDSIRIAYNNFGDVIYISKKEEKVINNKKHVINNNVEYIYDDNQNLEYKSGNIFGEPGVYEHNYVIDAQNNYISNEIWRLGEDNNEIIIEDSAKNTKTIRKYEEYEIKEDDYDYLSNSDKLNLISSGGVKKDGTQYFAVTRLIKEEHTDNANPGNSYESTIHYDKDRIVEKDFYKDGSIYVIKYNLTGEEIDSYWE